MSPTRGASRSRGPIGVALLLLTVLARSILAAGPVERKGDAEARRLLGLYRQAHDGLAIIHREILRYGDRLDAIHAVVTDPEAWGNKTRQRQLLLPLIQELNRIKRALVVIQNGLEARYEALAHVQDELLARYPTHEKATRKAFAGFERSHRDSTTDLDEVGGKLSDLKEFFRSPRAAARDRSVDVADHLRALARPEAGRDRLDTREDEDSGGDDATRE